MEFLKRFFLIILRIGISFILIFFLFKQIDKRIIFENIKNADKLFLALAFLLNFFIYFFCFLRWRMLIKASGIFAPLKRLIAAFCGGIFFNVLLPSAIGGDIVRVLDLGSFLKKRRTVFATVLLDRLSGCIGVVIVAWGAFLLGFRFIYHQNIFYSISLITILLLLILFFLFNSFLFNRIIKILDNLPFLIRINNFLKDFYVQISTFKNYKKIILKSILLSIFIQIIGPIGFYLLAQGLGIKIKIIYFFIFIPLIGAITLLPISLGGLGIRDVACVFFFSQVGVSKALAFSASLISFFFILIYAGLGGIIYVFNLYPRRIQSD